MSGRPTHIQLGSCAAYSSSQRELVRIIAHEHGHHLWFFLRADARKYWTAATLTNTTAIDLKRVLAEWPSKIKWLHEWDKRDDRRTFVMPPFSEDEILRAAGARRTVQVHLSDLFTPHSRLF